MFKLTIKTDNAAFEGRDRYAEVARILRKAADRIENGTFESTVRDYNGNDVGQFKFSGKMEEADV